MRFLDFWSLITGLASLISLFLALGEKFSNWRKYTLPLSCALGGFAIGRLSFTPLLGVEHVFNDGFSTGFMVIFFSIMLVVTVLAIILMRRNETNLAYIFFFMGMALIAPQIVQLYTETYNAIPIGDCLLLATEKEKAGDFENAITYLERCGKKIENKGLKEQIDKRIPELQQKLAERVNKSQAISPP